MPLKLVHESFVRMFYSLHEKLNHISESCPSAWRHFSGTQEWGIDVGCVLIVLKGAINNFNDPYKSMHF
jgi:hypothetical protein